LAGVRSPRRHKHIGGKEIKFRAQLYNRVMFGEKLVRVSRPRKYTSLLSTQTLIS